MTPNQPARKSTKRNSPSVPYTHHLLAQTESLKVGPLYCESKPISKRRTYLDLPHPLIQWSEDHHHPSNNPSYHNPHRPSNSHPPHPTRIQQRPATIPPSYLLRRPRSSTTTRRTPTPLPKFRRLFTTTRWIPGGGRGSRAIILHPSKKCRESSDRLRGGGARVLDAGNEGGEGGGGAGT